MKALKAIGILIAFLITLIGTIYLAKTFGLFFLETFGTKEESIKHEIFRNNKTYVEGMIRDLANYYQQWQTAFDDEKDSIENIIKIVYSDFDENKIQNRKLRAFLIQTRGY